MDAATFLALAVACAPGVHVDTTRALVEVESGFNPWAIGVVGGTLMRQPRNRQEGLATARALQDQGLSFSVGLGQINVQNFARLGLTLDAAFDPCTNLAALQTVLGDCFDRAGSAPQRSPQTRLRQALSCYYSGNFTTGFRHGYVARVVLAARHPAPALPTSTKEKT